jgi:hypothetical protein
MTMFMRFLSPLMTCDEGNGRIFYANVFLLSSHALHRGASHRGICELERLDDRLILWLDMQWLFGKGDQLRSSTAFAARKGSDAPFQIAGLAPIFLLMHCIYRIYWIAMQKDVISV